MSLSDVKQVPIAELAHKLGIELVGNKACCFAHEEKTPSLSFNDKENYFKCFGCGIGGSNIDLVMLRLGLNTSESISWIEREFNLQRKGRPSPSRLQSKGILLGESIKIHPTALQTHLTANIKKDGREFSSLYWTLLNMGDIERAITYLSNRGISSELIRNSRIRIIEPDNAENLKKQYDMKTLLSSGLFAISSKTGRPYYTLFAHTLVIPFFDRDGETILTLQGRDIEGKSNHKYQLLNGIETTLYNLHELEGASTVYLCEGALDVLSAKQLGMETPIGIAGVNNFKEEYYELLTPYNLIIGVDIDNAGQNFYREVVKQFLKRGKLINNLNWVELKAAFGVIENVKDLNDVAKLADYKHKKARDPVRIFSHVVKDSYIMTIEGISFDSGVNYSFEEIESLKGSSESMLEVVHKIKQIFNGRVIT